MLKKYQAKSHVSLSVLMENGKSVRVSFDSLTGGGSIFYTNDEELQTALENHAKFGKLFTLAEEIEDAKPTKTKKQETVKAPITVNTPAEAEEAEDNTEAGENVPDEGENPSEDEDNATDEDNTEDGEGDEDNNEDEGDGLKEITVTDIEDAKDYLAENFGICRTKLRGTKAFNDIAASHGIKFIIPA